MGRLDVGERGARDGEFAGNQVEHQGADAVQVALGRRRAAGQQFRGHVQRRTGQPGNFAGLDAGTEIHQHGPPPGSAHDVLRLDVAVDQARSVNGGERPAEVDADEGRLAGAHRAVGVEPLLERLAFEELHPETDAALVRVGSVDVDDVGVAQPGEPASLGDHRLFERRVFGTIRVQQLQRHLARELRIPRAIDGAVSAAADQLAQMQRAPLVRHRRGGQDCALARRPHRRCACLRRSGSPRTGSQ